MLFAGLEKVLILSSCTVAALERGFSRRPDIVSTGDSGRSRVIGGGMGIGSRREP